MFHLIIGQLRQSLLPHIFAFPNHQVSMCTKWKLTEIGEQHSGELFIMVSWGYNQTFNKQTHSPAGVNNEFHYNKLSATSESGSP